MKPYEEVRFPSGIIRWIREGDEYVCRLSEDQMNEIKEFHEEPWVKTYSGGKPNYTQPIEREPIGLPPVKVQDEREANYKSFAQSAQVLGAQHDPRRSPSGSWVSWENTMCNPLANARMQTQSAWQDGYDSAKAELAGIEPVAWMHISAVGNVYFRKKPQDAVFNPQPVYTAPPKKEWVGLPDAEKKDICQEATDEDWTDLDVINATEAKLKEKNT